ncbi:MAG TPA: D-alanyl-D-alanine carboxypeptidase family protein [Actinomycetota bacterium]|nr:D-alanyl-D-alanine carboxypeptidase family protein [Actinomycetota bacterium]
MSTKRLVAILACAVAFGATPLPPAAPAAAVAPPPRPEVTCAACLVALGDDVLWGREVDAPRANASTTKMVTALLVVRATDLDEPVRTSQAAAATGGGGLDLQPGDTFSAGDLLHALMMSSSNDAAVALAEHVAGSEAAVVSRMNRLAASLGARGSHFVTPHGLDVPGHFSTARDLARIALAVLRRPVLAEIVATRSATISGSSGSHRLVNTNPLLETYPGAIGIKTGYTAGAGDVLVAAAERGGRRLVAVAMGSVSAPADATALLDYGFRLLGRGVLVEEGSVLGDLVFDSAGAASVVAGRTLRGLLDPATVEISFEPDGGVSPPLDRGETVGSVVVSSPEGEVVGRGPAIAQDALPEADGGGAASVFGAVLRAAGGILGGRSW